MKVLKSSLKIAVLALAAISSAAHAVNANGAKAGGGGESTDQIVVKFESGSRSAVVLQDDDLAGLKGAMNGIGFSVRHLRTSGAGWHVFKIDRFEKAEALKALLGSLTQRNQSIISIEPDYVVHPAQAIPNDPLYPSQWHLQNSAASLNAVGAWTYSTGTGVVIGVIDTGYTSHVDLTGNLLAGYDFVSDVTSSNDGDGRDAYASDPGDWRVAGQCPSPRATQANSDWHGTHVAGIAAASMNNSIGVVGVAPNAKILPVRALGACGGYSSDVADAVTWASGGAVTGVPANPNPAKVLNLSLYGAGACPSTIQSAFSSARGRGSVIMVAAGNDSADASGAYPGNCQGVITVAATDSAGQRASFSNYGSNVSLAAPGVAILSTYNTGTTVPAADSYVQLDGTSMATPGVAGVAALMLSANASLNPDDVTIVMKGTANAFPSGCTGCGAGIANALNAVNAVRTGAPLGTLSTVYGTRNSSTSLIVLSNTGSGWITGISASCSQSSAHITRVPPSALGPGQTMTIEATVSPFTYTCGYVVNANNVTTKPYVNNTF